MRLQKASTKVASVRLIERPEIVHQLKESAAKLVVTKCGIEGKPGKIRTTAWFTDITCDDCSPTRGTPCP